MSPLLTEHQKEAIEKATVEYLAKARAIVPTKILRPVAVSFTLRGSAAGQYRPRELHIRYNPEIAAANYADFLVRTVPHEVAHHVIYEIYGSDSRVRAHGRQWQTVMRRLGVRDVTRCHNYDMATVTIGRQQQFTYACACREYQISKTRHNRVQRGVKYHCKYCNQVLVPVQIQMA